MQKYFEKIKERLRLQQGIAKRCLDFKTTKTYANAIEIVNQVAEETTMGKVSDGYHTFDELYHHRAVLFAVICNTHKELAWKSKLHDTGDMYDGMFIVGIETPEGQATYHYDINPYWDMFNVKELPKAPKWDGHTPDEAIRRIGLLDSNDGWIACSERLPEEEKGYIVQRTDGTIDILVFTKDAYKLDNYDFYGYKGKKKPIFYDFDSEYGYCACGCVAWMPLPPVYKPKGE